MFFQIILVVEVGFGEEVFGEVVFQISVDVGYGYLLMVLVVVVDVGDVLVSQIS